MGKLIHKDNIILSDMKIVRSILNLFIGLRLSNHKKINNGMCFIMSHENRYPVDMWFCFYSYDILFIDSNLKVVDKISLQPWKSYLPRKRFKYIIESKLNRFKEIKMGDKIKII